MQINFQRRVLGKVKNFFKQYGYYSILAASILTLTLIVVLSSPLTQREPASGGTILFSDPVANANLLKEYSADQLLFNKTLNRWEAHKAVDLAADAGTNVMAVYDGVVYSVYNNYMEGTVVVLDHGNGLKTLYGSLESEVNVEVGDSLKKGDLIGKVSASAQNEFEDGPHLHFEVWEDGVKVDPAAYLTSLEK